MEYHVMMKMTMMLMENMKAVMVTFVTLNLLYFAITVMKRIMSRNFRVCLKTFALKDSGQNIEHDFYDYLFDF